jgi:uncharacterized protein (TIGR02996 family)
MPTESDLLRAIESDPGDDLAWLALADYLEETGEAERAELVRLREWLRTEPVPSRERSRREKRLAELLIKGVRPSVPVRQIDLDKGVTLPLVLIPAGTFWMGSPAREKGRWADEGPRHEVRISKPFWLGRTPVTQAQHQRVMKPEGRAKPKASANKPACNVGWRAAQDCCSRLSERVGGLFRLPSEAEWEYACRAGTTTSTYLGNGEDKAALAGWYVDNAGRRLHAVGEKVPNAWGLSDMLGNVWNWCADGRRDFTKAPSADPVGPDRNRGIKGASWKSMGFRVRCAARFPYQEDYAFDDLGFRVLMEWR